MPGKRERERRPESEKRVRAPRRGFAPFILKIRPEQEEAAAAGAGKRPLSGGTEEDFRRLSGKFVTVCLCAGLLSRTQTKNRICRRFSAEAPAFALSELSLRRRS